MLNHIVVFLYGILELNDLFLFYISDQSASIMGVNSSFGTGF